jgi:HAD superfamily hydrolase (TIGR01509 family)
MIRALVFDFDGLIIDSEAAIYQSWQELYTEYGYELPVEDWLLTIGTAENYFDPWRHLEQLIGRAVDWGAVNPRRRARERELVMAQPVLPGVEAYLMEARRFGLQTGLASSSSCEWVTGHLERLGLLGYFDCLQARDDVPRTKPDPALYRSVLEIFQVRGEEAIAFEDSLHGILAARAAEMHCVAVPNALTRRLSMQQASLRLDSLAELSLARLLEIAAGWNSAG